MRRLFIALCPTLLLLPSTAFAQAQPSIAAPYLELFGGYGYLRPDTATPRLLTGGGAHGWDASAVGNLSGWFGVEANVGGRYSPSIRSGLVVPGAGSSMLTPYVYSFLFGPKVTLRATRRVSPFAHVLFGVARAQAGLMGVDFVSSQVDSGFALSGGGGFDVALSRNFALRPLQAQFFQAQLFGRPQRDLTLSSGFVLKLWR